ncbi:folate-binding protein YgfZ [Luteimonas sp. MC1825]|uniref:CAF17-like 4Fe-4S cluster assembly/insertion protein YgfZ n=1 Tax=Luteimonas sp. MC1825 TaxID=2761107 RepID=UPI00162213DE|nr:folate-binding protein YgfZ [Luteimonas sp. MC1825]MBB6599014.1 folate-binding protein YgfZ [Luteimonas sp. MC1825]QOC89150.1 folate-binding protein YgfZ [Luteimonas sp. MC1825]
MAILDKPGVVDAGCFALPDHAVISLEGRDALAFAQAQCMSDVAALADNGWQWSGWLTPKGRVIALFAVLRLGPEQVWMLVPDGDTEALAARLRGLVFRSKVKVEARPDLHVAGAFAAPEGARGAVLAGDAASGVELDLGDGTLPRRLRVSAVAAGPDPAAQARWHAFDLAHGWPRLPPSQTEAWTPQQLSLDRLKAYSVRKGCYPGQEIVARTHFLGKAKRGLVLFGAPVAPAAGSDVLGDGKPLGTVACSGDAAGSGFPAAALALAVLPLERDDSATLEADGRTLAVLPLRDGLAR